MRWSKYSMEMLTTIICLISENGLLAQASTVLGHSQVTQAEGQPISVAYEGGLYSVIRLDRLRDSGSQSAGLKASSFSTFSRRLLQDSSTPPDSSHKLLSRGATIGVGIGIPFILGVIAVMVMWYCIRKRRASLPRSTSKSTPTGYAQDEASTSKSPLTCTPNVGFKGFPGWTNSCLSPSRMEPEDPSTPTPAPSSRKPKDPSTPSLKAGFLAWMNSCSGPSSLKTEDPLTPTPGSKVGFQPWMKRLFWVSPKPKVYLSSACEMEFSKLQAATDNFSEANLLGEGGSARVYKAKLDGGDYGAVKMITAGGRNAAAEFQAEVDLMRQVRDPNLVSLLGYSAQGDRYLLVYELMRNGSLEDQLYGPKQGTGLSWFRRIKIALDSARGLEYLHEHCVPPVVHRDFKASNILLDESLNAKISDFGLATALEGLTQEESLQLVGTIGYVAPEFFSGGTLTEKSDVYAFGVTLLELLTGRKPIDHSLPPEEQSLVNWAAPQLTSRSKLPKLVAWHIQQDMILKHLYQVAAVAALCVQKEPSYRPLIADVVQSLLPLVPVGMGGALRSDFNINKSSAESSRSSSQRQLQPDILKLGSESFTFAEKGAHDFDYDFPPDISSAASSEEMRAARR